MPRKGIVTTDPLYWLPANIDEWLVKLAGGLTTEQFGAAVLLIFTSWRQKPAGSLPSDDDFLAQRSGLGSRWRRHCDRILEVAQFYPAQRGRLVCGWLAQLHKEQLEKYEHRSRAGKENRAKRDQTELVLIADGTNGRTIRRTKPRTIGTSNTSQSEKVEGVAPTGLTPEHRTERPPDAPAPSGARAGSSTDEQPVEDRTVLRQPSGLQTMRPATDILRMAKVPRPGEG